ncbi:MAG: DNA-binding protein [Nanoarchaeota archaeon]|nr:DNA-binding protein [Nanoarchaeota archaeon]
MNQSREENAIVLDYLQHGYSDDPSPMKSSIAQAIGKAHFTLLELVPKKGVFLQPYQEVYIGEGKRDDIHHIKGKIPYERLTQTARSELRPVVESLIEKNSAKFVEFFNKAQPLSTRMHQLELLPGLGKKHMWEIIQERKGKPFESLQDLKSRVKLMPDPKTIVVKRIISELEGMEKHRIFVS